MFSILKIILIIKMAQTIYGNLTISKIVVRVPHPNDIGLIIDITVTNAILNDQPALIEFSIHPEKSCRIEICPNTVMDDAGHIMGGNFGSIEAGASETVSLIWPTVSLFNRVGSCPIIVTSTNPKNEQTHVREEIKFDTRFTALDPESNGLRKAKNFKDCQNFDLDYLNNCKPVNCEERYFGRRNFFNHTKQRCEEVPRCVGRMLYDPFANECVDSHYTVTKEDINNIKMGNFKEYDEWLKLTSHDSSQKYLENIEPFTKNRKRESYEFNKKENKFDASIVDTGGSYFLKGVLDGLMLVFATIGIYVLICFVIFLVVSCISKRQKSRSSITFSITPSVSEKSIKLPSRSSIIKRKK